LRNANEVYNIVCKFGSEATLDEMELMFDECKIFLEWISEHGGEYVCE
jgi:hypothetical protein